MDKVFLFRLDTGNEGTFGVIVFNSQYLYTGELPWRQNKSNVSCIPAGIYTVCLRISPKYGTVYEVRDVKGRSYILFHQGNYSGDLLMGFRTNVQGCILLGFKRGILNKQKAVLASRLARRRFERVMQFDPFILEIRNVN